jgi:TonB family protein
MSVLFNDSRFDTRARSRSRSTTGLWLSVVGHATIAGVLIAIVPTRASEKSSTPRLRSIAVFRWPSAEPATAPPIHVAAPRLPSPPAPSRPAHDVVIAEVPKPVAVTPIAARPVGPAPATLPPAAAAAFERPLDVAAIERPPEIGVFERANGPRASQPVAAITTGGFGSVAPSPRGAANDADVRTAGFDRRASAPVQLSGAAAARPIDRSVEILFKPSPEYTDEARNARIEGTVTLDLEFTATGDVRVLRVVRGLGYGLDEAAERAALRMRFKPAQSDGRAVDCRATVHITFRLS